VSTWVFLRGLIRESRHWGDFPAVFGNHIAQADIVLLDLPGNGRLHRLSSPMRVEDMVECYREALAAKGLKPPYNTLALSLGGMIAVAWAERYPAELDRCVLINTSLRPFSPFYQRLKIQSYRDLAGLAIANGNAEKRERLIFGLTTRCRNNQEDIVDAWAAYRRECPVSGRNALRQLIAASRYRAPLKKPAVPMLVLTSSFDRLVDSRCSQRIASQWQTDLFMHPEAGHDLPMDDGPWVARQIRDWLLKYSY
jgi:pimeloyl-ACP methyl ester carboxylesterase